MATLGFADLKDTSLPSLWDAAELKKIELADSTSFEQIVQEVQVSLGGLNAELLGLPHYSGMFAVDDEAAMEYPIGVSNGVEEATEYGMPDPQRGATTGHMLPLKQWDRAMGWTMMYLRKHRAKKLDADVRSAITDARNHFQKRLLTRFFSSSGNTVGSTSNADVPLADGGSTDSNYVPPDSPEGESFTSSHDHILDTGDLTDDAIGITDLEYCVEHLQEHGHQGPYELIVPRGDLSSWTDVTGWKKPEWPGIVYHSSAVERANIAGIENYAGYIETQYGVCRVWATPRLESSGNYWGLFKSYGAGDPRNPLRLRIDPSYGFGWNIVPGNWVNSPVELLLMYAEFGVGIGEDRTNGVIAYTGGASWSDPTIS
jgi:hypothetical protein